MAVKPVAKFIDAEYRRISSAEDFGVAAFSRFGIASVAFTLSDSVNPDVTDSISAESWNTNQADWVWCYNANLDPSSLNDGAVTLTVLVTDGNANTRTITHNLMNNAGGTLRFHEAWVDVNSGDDGTGEVDNESLPFATIMAAADSFGLANGDDHDPGGCTIYLTEGDHNYGNYSFGQNIESQSADWLKITKADTADRANTRIVSTNTEGIRGYYIWFDNLTIACNQSTFTIGPRNTTTGTRYLRTSNLVVEDIDYAGQVEAVTAFTGGWDEQWHQNNTVNNLRNGWGANLVRGIHYTRLGEDVMPSCPCAINVVCDEVDYGSYAGTWHPDGIQLFSVNENLLYYNIRMLEVTGQLVFQGDSLTAANNVALVNVFAKESSGSGFVSQFLSGYEHLMMYHCHFDQTMRFDETELTLTDLDIRNCYFDSMNAQGGSQATVEASGTIDYCMFGDGTLWGTNGIDGSTKAYNDSGAGDFSWASSSPGYQEGSSTVPYTPPTGDRGPGANPDANAYPDASVPVGFLTSSFGESFTGVTDGQLFISGDDKQVDINVSGTYTTGTPVSLEYRLVNNSVAGAWTKADEDSSIGAGVFSLVARNVRDSKYWYTVDVRTLDAAGSVLETLTGADEFCVGKLVALHGQSNANYFGSSGSKTRSYATTTITWNGSALTYSKSSTGQGAVALAETLANAYSCAIGVYNGAIAGCALLEYNSYIEDIPSYVYVSFPFWLGPNANAQEGTTRSSQWPQYLLGLQAAGEPSWIIFIGGEADCLQHSPVNTPTNTYGRPVSRLDFKLALVDLKKLFVAAGYEAPMYVSPLGQYHFDDTVVTEWEESHSEVRDIQASTELGFLGIHPCPSHYDLPRVDLAHLSGADYEVLANRIANTIIAGSARSLGPIIKSAVEIDKARKQILVNVEHVTGTTLAFGSDNAPRDDLFVIKEDGTPVTIASVQLQDSAFLITLSSALTGDVVELAYIRGTGFDSTEAGALVDKWASVAGTGGAIFDDAGYPMQPQPRFISVDSYRGF